MTMKKRSTGIVAVHSSCHLSSIAWRPQLSAWVILALGLFINGAVLAGPLGKAGKKVFDELGDLAELAAKANPDLGEAKGYVNADGLWQVRQPGGTAFIDVTDAQKVKQALGDKPLTIVIRGKELPKNLQHFDQLAPNVRVEIAERFSRYSLTRPPIKGQPYTLNFKRLSVSVNNAEQLDTAVGQLSRRAVKGKLITVDIAANASDALSPMTAAQVLRSPGALRGKTLVVKAEHPLYQTLQTAAQRGDWKLHTIGGINDSMLVRQLNQQFAGEPFRGSTGELLNYITSAYRGHPQARQFELQAQGSRSVVSNQPRDRVADKTTQGSSPQSFTILPAIWFDLPSTFTQDESGLRMHPQIPALLSAYYVVSFLAGLLSIGYLRQLWYKLWPKPTQLSWGWWLPCFLGRTLIFWLLFWPLLGIWAFLIGPVISVIRLFQRVEQRVNP